MFHACCRFLYLLMVLAGFDTPREFQSSPWINVGIADACSTFENLGRYTSSPVRELPSVVLGVEKRETTRVPQEVGRCRGGNRNGLGGGDSLYRKWK